MSNITFNKAKTFIAALCTDYSSKQDYFTKILEIVDSGKKGKTIQHNQSSDSGNDVSTHSEEHEEKKGKKAQSGDISVRNDVTKILVELAHQVSQEIINTATALGEEHLSLKLLKALEGKEHYKLYRDFIPRVTRVGEDSFKNQNKDEYKKLLRDAIKKTQELQGLKSKKQDAVVYDQTAQLIVLFVSSLVKRTLVAIKLKRLKTVDTRALFPVLMCYYKNTDDIGHLFKMSKEKPVMVKATGKKKKSCASTKDLTTMTQNTTTCVV